MQRIVYFTAGTTPTSGELADIAKLNAAAEAAYEVTVVNGAANAKYGETNRLIPCDLVAGTVPTIYNAKEVIDPDAIPARGLAATEAIVQAGTPIAITGGTVTFTVVDNEITGGVFTPTP
ncbi:virion structural protein [Xanthomonas phage Samson]|uniref:Virion structural protein n=1 Tax=Xanthomonas phage Samson TaxID=2596676 RepID=A0A5B9N6X5_9CAUD|nr:virion structural protein [Xanthomonas phage Samson]QEG09329.1 hypothetical protein Samson_013 [Xanthomonas phage Samson]